MTADMDTFPELLQRHESVDVAEPFKLRTEQRVVSPTDIAQDDKKIIARFISNFSPNAGIVDNTRKLPLIVQDDILPEGIVDLEKIKQKPSLNKSRKFSLRLKHKTVETSRKNNEKLPITITNFKKDPEINFIPETNNVSLNNNEELSFINKNEQLSVKSEDSLTLYSALASASPMHCDSNTFINDEYNELKGLLNSFDENCDQFDDVVQSELDINENRQIDEALKTFSLAVASNLPCSKIFAKKERENFCEPVGKLTIENLEKFNEADSNSSRGQNSSSRASTNEIPRSRKRKFLTTTQTEKTSPPIKKKVSLNRKCWMQGNSMEAIDTNCDNLSAPSETSDYQKEEPKRRVVCRVPTKPSLSILTEDYDAVVENCKVLAQTVPLIDHNFKKPSIFSPKNLPNVRETHPAVSSTKTGVTASKSLPARIPVKIENAMIEESSSSDSSSSSSSSSGSESECDEADAALSRNDSGITSQTQNTVAPEKSSQNTDITDEVVDRIGSLEDIFAESQKSQKTADEDEDDCISLFTESLCMSR